MSQTALITGASGGIGYELAIILAQHGFDCVLVARSHEKLSELARRLEQDHHVKTLILAKDLSRSISIDEIYEEVSAAMLTIDVLVNNAGFSVFGLFAETDWKQELEMLQVNVVALTALTKLFLVGMIERKSGHILNLASTAAFQPGPLTAIYSATKAYVLSFSEALAEEVRGSGVTVTALAPGPTRTGFQKRAKMEDSRLVQGQIADARSVAEAGYQGMMAGKRLVVPGFGNKLVPWGARLLPRDVMTGAVRRAQQRVSH